MNLWNEKIDIYLREKWLLASAILYKNLIVYLENTKQDIDILKLNTLELRDLSEKVWKYYWKNLKHSNAIDWIDSAIAYFS